MHTDLTKYKYIITHTLKMDMFAFNIIWKWHVMLIFSIYKIVLQEGPKLWVIFSANFNPHRDFSFNIYLLVSCLIGYWVTVCNIINGRNPVCIAVIKKLISKDTLSQYTERLWSSINCFIIHFFDSHWSV